MPVKIGTFLNNLAAKLGGIDTSSQEWIDLLATNLEVPDVIVNSFNNRELLTDESARNNPKLKSHFTALALNGGDDRIAKTMEELAFPDEFKSEISGITNTFDRINLLAKKALELGNKKAESTGKEKTEIANQYNAMQQEIANLKLKHERESAEKEKMHLEQITNLTLKNKLSTKKIDLKKFNDDSEMAHLIAMNYINKTLTEKGIKISNENQVLKLKQAQDESLDYYNDNQLYTVDNLLDEVLANNNLLAVNDPAPAPVNNGPTRHNNLNTQPANGNQSKPLTGMKNLVAQALADYQKGSI